MTIDLDKLEALAKAATPGPWQWFGNTKMKEVYLATVHGGRVFVMDFVRWGMAEAQPRFQVRFGNDGGIMRSLSPRRPRIWDPATKPRTGSSSPASGTRTPRTSPPPRPTSYSS